MRVLPKHFYHLTLFLIPAVQKNTEQSFRKNVYHLFFYFGIFIFLAGGGGYKMQGEWGQSEFHLKKLGGFKYEIPI